MPGPKDIPVETPSSSGESEKLKDSNQRKKRKFIKHGLANSQIPRASAGQRVEVVEQPLSDKFKEPLTKSLVPYRLRKSYSQMDMKQSKKNHYNRFPRNVFQESYDSIILPKPMLVQKSRNTTQDIFYPTKDSLYYVVDEPDNGVISAKAAGMRIFATIMLNAWRKRRDEVKRLSEELEMLQRRSIKVKNQIHVLNSVFRNEQKQNDKLSRQLRHASEEMQRLQSSVENLTTALISAKAEASLLEQQLHTRDLENETLNNILSETNSQLFKAMTQIRHLQTSLSCEQRTIQQLENQKNELLNEIAINELKCRKEEEQHLVEVYHKNEQLSKAHSEIDILETLLLDLKDKEFQLRDLRIAEHKLKNEVNSLKSEVKCLKEELNKCLSARLAHFWKNYVALHHNTLMLIHLGAFYLLPAVPPPRSTRMPISVSLQKVMSIIRD